MLTCRSCTNFFVQGDFSSSRAHAALRLLGLLLKLSHAESTLTQPTPIDSRTRSPPMSFGLEAISRSISASGALPTARILRRVLPKEIALSSGRTSRSSSVACR
jgi:hypothetical protein